MQHDNKIKIYLSYHKPALLLKDDIFQPIHVGRALHKEEKNSWVMQNLIGDDSGDNISVRNPNYCELTAQYWAWKNSAADLDYVGFMHYRRHLNFNTKRKFKSNRWGVINSKTLDDKYISDFGLNKTNLESVISKYDIVTVEPWDVRNAGSKNNFDHYASADPKLHIKDYELALNILREKYPEYCDSIIKYNQSVYGYFTNIFVMKTKIFNDYCKWLFDILFEVEKRTDISSYDFQEARIYGYISEWLFGIYITHLKQKNTYKIKELQRTFIEDTDLPEAMDIVFTCDENYAKYLGVTIASILNSKKPSDLFNFYVVDGGISDKTKKKIESLKKISDFNIKYLDIDKSIFESYPIKPGYHFKPVCYYRLILPDLLPHLNKVLYLDVDIIVRQSLKDLYNLSVSDVACLGVQDILSCRNKARFNLVKYINCGVILINLEKWRKEKAEKKFKDFIRDHYDEIIWCDQDVINCVLQSGIKYIGDKWNCQLTDGLGGKSEHFKQLRKHANVIHFISAKKPWHARGGKYDEYYFKALLNTPWSADYYKYLIGVLRRLSRNFIKTLFQITNTRWQAYKDITILGLHFYPKKQKLAPTLTKYRFQNFAIYLIPIKKWRERLRKHMAQRVYKTAWYLYSNGVNRKIVADFCMACDNRNNWRSINCHFYLIYISALVEMSDYDYADMLYNKYCKKYGTHDMFRFVYTTRFASYLNIQDENIDIAKYVYEKMARNIGQFKKLVKNKSVAVVGNAPCQLGKKTGKQIDSADIVIRFNNFTTVGFEEDYGSKTDVWVWGCGAGELEKREEKIAKSVQLMIWGPDWKHFMVSGDYHRFLYNQISDKNNKTIFEFFPMDCFMELRAAIPLKFNEHPSLGTTAIYYLLKYCDPKSIAYYGFSFLSNRANSKFTHYYEQGNENKPHPHDLNAETVFLRHLTKKDEK